MPDLNPLAEPVPTTLDPRKLTRDLHAFKDSRTGRSLWELAITLIPFIAVFTGTLIAVQAGYYIGLALTPLAGLLLLRLFIIQHDCGHGSFFASRSGNDWVGRAMGVFTLTPYDCWRRSHALHHAATGNLDARGFGDVDTLTVREFQAQSKYGRFFYRLYRHPIVLLGFGPAYLFLLRHRLPIGLMKEGARYWVSAMATNVVSLLILAALVFQFGFATTALVFFPSLLIAASLGVWLFYIQHQFEDAHWDKKSEWTFHDAALHGSTHLDLPQPLRWFTANIGVHHVHHLASRIPFYRLREVLTAHPELHDMNRFTALQTFKALRLALWDEGQRRLVTFREAAMMAGKSAEPG
ncbi:fatty acid desaturase [Pontixanthobacter gangjinensis]|uniref:Fatty acid desaturase n=1 Tax=Pontixanthobacter gangjinensis TaxID=1028742 RepID=A0A6I4SJJ4_9SPHN|nr:fatty acid desaturase [Pontixanthobacter gangjinensis]MXO55326.1 fatty acid desaturase [Pontixanthobacter gangjinensis]